MVSKIKITPKLKFFPCIKTFHILVAYIIDDENFEKKRGGKVYTKKGIIVCSRQFIQFSVSYVNQNWYMCSLDQYPCNYRRIF